MKNARDAILQTAARLFYRHGIRAVGVDRIIAESDVAKATLYKYFPSKDDLIAAVLDEAGAEYVSRIRADIERVAKTSRQKVLALFDVFYTRAKRSDFRGCPFTNAVSEVGATTPRVREIAQRIKLGLRRYLEGVLTEAGVSGDRRTLAMQFVMLLDGAEDAVQRDGDPSAMLQAKAAAARLVGVRYDGKSR